MHQARKLVCGDQTTLVCIERSVGKLKHLRGVVQAEGRNCSQEFYLRTQNCETRELTSKKAGLPRSETVPQLIPSSQKDGSERCSLSHQRAGETQPSQ